ncbi:MAG: DUF1727 domain-containing protein [Erysipelotrichaceae bacterium]
MKTKVVLLIAKAISFLLKKINRGGSFPGVIALRLQPDFLSQLTYPKTVILVTGTNGKTTTTNMLYDVLAGSNHHIIANLKGDNLKVGVASLLVNHTDLSLTVNTDVLLLEVDELSVPKVMAEVPITHMLVNNFFRDQLDRSGEMENVIRRIEKALEHFEGTLYLNGDDPNVVRLARFVEHVKYFGAQACAGSTKESKESSEGKFCVYCGQMIHYDFYQYSHIGRFHCDCGQFGNVAYDLQLRDIDVEEGTFVANEQTYQVQQKALYAMYNCAGIILLSNDLGANIDVQRHVFAHFDRMNGRNETYQLKNGNELILNLVKNPTGTNEVLKAINRDPRQKVVLMVLNDNDQDGKDVSWIWDAHFDRLLDEKVSKVICAGTRAYDMALRLKYSGGELAFEVVEDYAKAIERLSEHSETLYVISTYTALQKVRAVLRGYQHGA